MTFDACQLICLQSRSLDELSAAYQNIPAVTDPARFGSVLNNKFQIGVPHYYNMNSAIMDGELVREEPLKVGSQVPIIAGASESTYPLFLLWHVPAEFNLPYPLSSTIHIPLN